MMTCSQMRISPCLTTSEESWAWPIAVLTPTALSSTSRYSQLCGWTENMWPLGMYFSTASAHVPHPSGELVSPATVSETAARKKGFSGNFVYRSETE